MTDWLIEGLLPGGALLAVADLDDPPPEELLGRGFDVVHHLATRDAELEAGSEVMFSVHFHPRLGLTPPKPFLIRFDPEARSGGFWTRVADAAERGEEGDAR